MSDHLEKKNGELTSEDLKDKISDDTLGEVSGGGGANPAEDAMFDPKSEKGSHFLSDSKDGALLNPKPEDGTFLSPNSPEKH